MTLIPAAGVVLVAVALACSATRVPVVEPAVSGGEVVVVSQYTPFPTATPWPTFTPSPTVTPTITPEPTATATPEPTAGLPRVLRPTATPVPAEAVVPEATLEPTATMAPVPTPYARVWGTDVHLERRTLYGSAIGRIPDYMIEEDFKTLPDVQSEMPETTRYVMWLAVFDVEDAPEDFEMTGVERWLDVTWSRDDPLVIYQRHYTISKDSWVVNSGLGDDLPGAWQSGEYVIELWDDRDEVLARWEFSIR